MISLNLIDHHFSTLSIVKKYIAYLNINHGKHGFTVIYY